MNYGSSSNFGTHYKLPQGIVRGSEEAYQYLTGGVNFKVHELEVYRVKFGKADSGITTSTGSMST